MKHTVSQRDGNKKGFTLIELLVVIAIIGLLSTLAVIALGSAREKSRDAKRLSDLKQVQTALELYYTDNSEYPDGTGITLGDSTHACLDDSGFAATCGTDAYMADVPTDPISSETYSYTVSGTNNDSYTITAELEGTMNGLAGTLSVTPSSISATST